MSLKSDDGSALNKHGMMIAEGMDSTGKSWLVEKLGKEFHLIPIHCNGAKPFPVMESRTQMFLNWSIKAPLIFDRFHPISDMTYSRIPDFGRTNYFEDTVEGVRIYRCLRAVDPLIIACVTTNDLVGDQLAGVSRNKNALVDSYQKTFNKLIMDGFRVVYYDFKDPDRSYQPIRQLVKEEIARW